jgi:plastocyanin
LTLETGDSVWWKWTNTQALVTIKLSDYSLIWNKKIDIEKCRNIKDGCEQLDANGIARTGVRSFSIKFAGIYYFDIFDGDNISTFTIVATSVQKDHKISITDTEAKPKILEIYPEDRVWFVWDDTRKPKNIRQVNHQNEIIENGFLSGSLIESPGTFLHSFANEGVYFYRTDNLNEILGAVVVVQEPTVIIILIFKNL